MKRVIVFICLIILLLPLGCIRKNDILNFNYEKIIIVSANPGLELGNNVIKSGKDYYYYLERNSYYNKLKNLNFDDIKGVVLYISKDVDLNHFRNIFNYNISLASKVEGKNVYTGYYKGYDDYRLVNGKKINFQLVENNDEWILGFPLIMTGF